MARRRSAASDLLAGFVASRPRAAQPRPVGPDNAWYRIEAHAGQPAEVWIYDEIGYWGTTADEFCRDLAGLAAEEIVLRVNSPGGDVFDGLAIYNALLDHPAVVTARVDGLAASAASFIVQAADRVTMGRQAQMMIHDASGLCLGNAADMAEMASMLDRVSDGIAAIYHDRAAGGVKTWRARMQAETWYSAQEAVDAGLADEIMAMPRKQPAEPGAAAASWDLSVFRFAGREAAPSPESAAEPAAEPVPEPVPEPAEAVCEPVYAGFDPARFRDSLAAATEVPFDPAEFRDRMLAAAGAPPADPARRPDLRGGEPAPAAVVEAEPERPLTLAEFFAAAVSTAAASVPAPTVPDPAPPPEPTPGLVFDAAAIRRAVKEARL